MNFFSDSLARLKHGLRVSKDQEVADALGLSKTAFSERKKRGSFPEKELHALAAKRPDLGLDVDYVLSGVTEAESLSQRDALHAAGGVPKSRRDANQAEVELLAVFRACPPDVQEALRKVLVHCAKVRETAGAGKGS